MTIIKGKTQDGEEQYVYANPYRSPYISKQLTSLHPFNPVFKKNKTSKVIVKSQL